MDLLEKYIHDNSSPEDALLHELDRQTHLQVINPRMIPGHIQGKLLELLVKMFRPKNILEIGLIYLTFSTLSFCFIQLWKA